MLHEVSLPRIGSLGGFSGKMKDNTAFYSFTSFNYPTTTFKYNIEENLQIVLKSNPDKLEATQGKLIPILVQAIKDLKKEIDELKKS